MDWAIRLHVRSRDDVTKRNQRALVNLKEQFHQWEGELSRGHGIAAAAEDLAAYAEEIESDKSEVEAAASRLFAVCTSTAEVAISLQRALAKRFEENDYRLVAPLGYQEMLWHVMNPGSPTPPVVREFAQLTTSTHFSAYVPFTRADLGDSSGPLLGFEHHVAACGCRASRRRDQVGVGHLRIVRRQRQPRVWQVGAAEADRG